MSLSVSQMTKVYRYTDVVKGARKVVEVDLRGGINH